MQIVARRAEVTGDELSDRDPASKLWPSDHAGVVVEIRIGWIMSTDPQPVGQA